ncbi:MAG: hypothetical protein GY749_08885 [Desulfobacteraceae bacterium]|nr:hypothetical protein [Desulfobacteraceae bacterium]
MNAVRQLYENLPKVINVPDVLKNRRVEVIMLPLDEEDKPEKQNTRRKMNPIDEFIGAWGGEPLVRPDQGEYEIREPLK